MPEDHRRPGIAWSRAEPVPAGHLPPARHLDCAVRCPAEPLEGAGDVDARDLEPDRDGGCLVVAHRLETASGVQPVGRPGWYLDGGRRGRLGVPRARRAADEQRQCGHASREPTPAQSDHGRCAVPPPPVCEPPTGRPGLTARWMALTWSIRCASCAVMAPVRGTKAAWLRTTPLK